MKRIVPLPLPQIDLRTLLGGMTPRAFLRDYWHKKPLLVRQAIPGFGQQLSPDALRTLACHPDAESRLIRNRRGRWSLEYGPFSQDELETLPKRDWSLLVSGINHWLPAGDQLLHAFNFIPHARLDDLMVSLAPTGGGVGPHFDSYDVFLIQGHGTRRWEISAQDDLALVENAPLRILKRFSAEESWVLAPGDMLYLPPKYAHNGVALTDCMTWSVGFRAPTYQEIATAFLTDLQDRICLEGRYADPGLSLQKHPGAIPPAMLETFSTVLDQVNWTRADVNDFIGRYLSEPKPNVFFAPPSRPMSAQRFAERVQSRGIALDPRSRLLFRRKDCYLNGERCEVLRNLMPAIQRLADNRCLTAAEIPAALISDLYDWYRSGYIHTK